MATGSQPFETVGLLIHTSGLPREAASVNWSDLTMPKREEMIRRIGELETVFPAETEWKYSNLGLTLAGEIVASVFRRNLGRCSRKSHHNQNTEQRIQRSIGFCRTQWSSGKPTADGRTPVIQTKERHPGEDRTTPHRNWIPAFAGMTILRPLKE
jgi:hypothetical protein